MPRYVNSDGDFDSIKFIRDLLIGLLIIFLVIWLWPFGTVGAGERGVVLNFSAANGGVKQPGLYFRIPIVQHVVEINTQVQKEQTDANAASKDLQNVKATIALNYHIDSSQVVSLYKNIGDNDTIKSKLLDPALQESVKAVTANYTAEELITKRESVKSEIKDLVSSKLSPFGIITDSFNVINFDFSDTFNTAIEAKVTAQQNALAAQNKLQQVQFEAQQRVAQAQGEAEAIKIQAQAINAQGGADYVQLQAIKQWDGKLPTQMVPGSTVPFINLTK